MLKTCKKEKDKSEKLHLFVQKKKLHLFMNKSC